MSVLIGTSGWSYDHWVGVLYPKSATSLGRLDAYARHFRTVEVNNTFYRWPRDEVFSTWRERSPAGFVFSAKASRGLTQFRKLNDPGPWLGRMEAGLSRLGEKRGDRVYIDVLQNARGHHAVPPYVLRAVPGATVSTPVDWTEVADGLDPKAFTLKKALARFTRRKTDPFEGLLKTFTARRKAKAR